MARWGTTSGCAHSKSGCGGGDWRHASRRVAGGHRRGALSGNPHTRHARRLGGRGRQREPRSVDRFQCLAGSLPASVGARQDGAARIPGERKIERFGGPDAAAGVARNRFDGSAGDGGQLGCRARRAIPPAAQWKRFGRRGGVREVWRFGGVAESEQESVRTADVRHDHRTRG